MAQYNTLKDAVAAVIKTNGNKEITGEILQQTLLAIINSLGAGFQYLGIAAPSTNPGTPDQNVLYIAGPGTYPNFNGAIIPDQYVGFMSYNGAWTLATIKTSAVSLRDISDGIVQMMDGDNPIYPRTKPEAVFFDNDVQKTLAAYLNAGYLYAGVAVLTPTPTSPGTPAGKVFYLVTEAGTYTNFSNLVVNAGEVAIFKYNGSSWSKDSTGLATAAELNQLGQKFYDESKETLPIGSTLAGKFINSSGGASDFSSYDILLYDITEYEGVDINVSGAAKSLHLYGFYNSETISSGNLVELGPEPTGGSYNNTMKKPSGATILAVTSYRGNQTTVIKGVTYEEKFDKLQNEIESLEEGLSDVQEEINDINDELNKDVETQMFVYQTLQNQFLSSAGTATAFNGYDILLFDVSEINRIHINVSGAASSLLLYAFYNSTTISSANVVLLGTQPTEGNYNQTIDVPSGASILAITSYRGNQTTIVGSITKKSKLDDIYYPLIQYLIDGQSIYLAVPSGTNNLVYKLGPTTEGSGNGLFDFRQIGTLPKGSIVPGNISTIISSSSDCFGPYQIYAQNNIDGDDISGHTFTGGSHRYNNTQTGTTPTARMDSLDFYIDGNRMTSGQGYASIVKMVWTNYIQASNTKKENGTGREVLRETITLEFDGIEFRAFNDIVPLEDLTLGLYYGYQFGGIGNAFAHWRYVNANERIIDQANSGGKDCGAVFADGTLSLQMWLNESIDLGKRLFCYNSANGGFQSGSKIYFTIANNNATIYANAHYYMSGKYKFNLI